MGWEMRCVLARARAAHYGQLGSDCATVIWEVSPGADRHRSRRLQSQTHFQNSE